MVYMGSRADFYAETACAAVMVFELIGFPAALVGHERRVIATNSRLEGLGAAVVQQREGRLELVNPRADLLLTDALASIACRTGRASRWPLPIPASTSVPPIILHIISLHDTAHELIPNALALLVLIPVFGPTVPAPTVVQGLFDMTPAEARVARAAAQGKTIAEIAKVLGVSRETVRSQLKAALAKAGCDRNIDLAGLLAGAGSLIDVDLRSGD